MTADKRVTLDEIVSSLSDGMTIGIGGWGSRRKPMSIVRAIARSSLKDLTVVSYGGPDVGLLCATGKVRHIVFGFVTLDSISIEPHFRAARQAGTVEVTEYDEGMFYLGLLAAAWRVPFLPTRAHEYKLPLTLLALRIEHYEAMPEINVPSVLQTLSMVLGHYIQPIDILSKYMTDDVFLMAAKQRFVSTERVVETEDLLREGPVQTLRINRSMVDGVVETPHGAHFTSCEPDYPRDEGFQREYAGSIGDKWPGFLARYVDVDETAYQAAVAQ